MKIIILDPYFETLGGGEKVVVVMAEHLAKHHEVIILVKDKVDKKFVGGYFNVQLDSIHFELLPKPSILIRLLTNRYSRLPGRWKSILYDWTSLRTLQKLKADLFINNLYQSSLPSPSAKSIYMCMFPQKLKADRPNYAAWRRFYNRLTDRLEAGVIGSRKQAINSYSLVVANSNYTASWVKKYWGRQATVIYPVCDDMGPPAAKNNIILSVGRFFADNGSSHHKRHDELIKAFIKLDRSDWELHLAGSLAEDKDSAKYFGGLQKITAGHANIFIHPNMPFVELRKLRQQAAIYWHAAGYGYDPDVFPENQEHFGMVTAEAMSAGAVPVVYNGAGQKEVVTNGVNGYLWDDIDGLLLMTQKLMDNSSLREKLAKAAVKRSNEFDRSAFNKRLDKLMTDLA